VVEVGQPGNGSSAGAVSFYYPFQFQQQQLSVAGEDGLGHKLRYQLYSRTLKLIVNELCRSNLLPHNANYSSVCELCVGYFYA
jgi:hypothetical protein